MSPDPFSARLVAAPRTARLYTLGSTDAPETWLALHGYGQLGRFFARRLAPHAGPHRRILVPEAPARFYLDGTYRRVGASWMTREERTSDIADTHAYLDAVTSDTGMNGEETTEPAPLVGFGFSQGGMVLVRYAAARPGRFSRLVLWGSAPPDDVDLAATPLPPLTFVLGTDDAYLTPERRETLATRLATCAAPFDIVTYNGGHRVDPDALARLVAAHCPTYDAP